MLQNSQIMLKIMLQNSQKEEISIQTLAYTTTIFLLLSDQVWVMELLHSDQEHQ